MSSFQVRVYLGLPDHKWQDRCPEFAQSVDALGDQFRPVMCTGWLAYIKNAYADAAPAARSCRVQGTVDVLLPLPPRGMVSVMNTGSNSNFVS